MRVRYAEAARRDIAEIIAYVAADNPNAAEAIDRAFLEAVRMLARFPGIGRVGHVENTREFFVPNLPYVLVYEVADEALTVVAILHGARDVPRVLDARDNEEKP